MTLTGPAGSSALAFGIALALAWLLGLAMRRWGAVDAPDEARKHQATPVPRLGGVAIFIAMLATIALLANWTGLSLMQNAYAPLGYVILAFVIGLWDDLAKAPTLIKLQLLLIGGATCAAYGLVPDTVSTPFGDLDLALPLIIGSVLWLLVFTNSANFMDGSNGLSMGCLLIMFVGLCAAMLAVDPLFNGFVPLWFAAFGAIVGFLIHNLQGKLYAGDAGALGLGALFASLGLVSGLEVWSVATLALPFLIDVLMTLIWRAKHGRSWLKPHLDHAYQNLRLSEWSHTETAFLYWGLSATCAAATYIAAKAGGAAPFIVFWALCLSGIIIWTLHRRTHTAEQ
ncbi:MAG: hypothetical protein AAGB16_08630 [Pseudomonadota bacterium]